MKVNRVIAYIDGFNLYFGLKDSGWKRYYWLNIALLCKNLLISNQELISVKYYTARVTYPLDKVERQKTYLEALQTLDKVEIIPGEYYSNLVTCKNCGEKHYDFKEKMTDVNMAIGLVSDAIDDIYDIAILITADSDLVPAIKLTKKIKPEKRIIVYFPPNRHSRALQEVADTTVSIFRNRIAKSLLPETVIRQDGFILKKPDSWV